MQKVGVKTLAFSSCATIDGGPSCLSYDVDHPTRPMNPYGHITLQVEEILRDLADSDLEWRITGFKYFNSVDTHVSTLIGEDTNGIPSNLITYIMKAAVEKVSHLIIFDNEHDTKDCARESDYIHVIDLVGGHMTALEFLQSKTGLESIALGTEKPSGVFDLISTFETVTGLKINKAVVGRLAGDLSIYYSKSAKANQLMKWAAIRSFDQICGSTWCYLKFRDIDALAAGNKKIQ